MKNKMLLSNRWKTLGWILTIPSLLAGIYYLSMEETERLQVRVPDWARHFLWINTSIFENSNQQPVIALMDELIALPLFAGLLLLAFSAEKTEDEWVEQVRLRSLQWAVLINTLLLMAFTIFTHGMPFFTVMIYNMFTPLLIFTGRFYYVLWSSKN